MRLSERLIQMRTDRPDEYQMDELTKLAKKLENQVDALNFELYTVDERKT